MGTKNLHEILSDRESISSSMQVPSSSYCINTIFDKEERIKSVLISINKRHADIIVNQKGNLYLVILVQMLKISLQEFLLELIMMVTMSLVIVI